MRLVIDIPEDFYKGIVDDKYRVHEGRIFNIIRNGTPLQKEKWIPVSEPLKELPKDRRLLVTVEEEVYPGDIRCYVTELHYDMTEWIESIHDAENTIAYQCYPEPYKAESEDQND